LKPIGISFGWYKTGNSFTPSCQEYLPVYIINKDTLAGIASGSDVIYRARIFYS
jgi:hypothetical protein